MFHAVFNIGDKLIREEKKMLSVSKSLIIGFDSSDEDDSVLTVNEIIDNNYNCINVFMGKEAEELYEKLTNKS